MPITDPARLLTTSPGLLPAQIFPDNYVGTPLKQEFIRIDPATLRNPEGNPVQPGTLILRPYVYATRDIKEIDRSRFNFVQKFALRKIDAARAMGQQALAKARELGQVAAGIPAQTLKQPTYPVRLTYRAWKAFWRESANFFAAHRWIGRTLPFLFIGSNYGRGIVDYASLEIDRYEHMVETPTELRQEIFSSGFTKDERDGTFNVDHHSLDWTESLQLIRKYPNDAELVKKLIDGMFSQIESPEGALYLTDALLETFQLSPTLDAATKAQYQQWIAPAFDASTKTLFGMTTTALQRKGVLDSFDTNGDGIPDTPLTAEQQTVIQIFLEDLEDEKAALLTLNEDHSAWVESQLMRRARFDDPQNPGVVVLENPAAPEIQATIEMVRSREKRLSRLPTDWETVRYKLTLNKMGQYQSAVDQSYKLMNDDFTAHNRDYWTVLYDSTTDADSGLVGGGSMLVGMFYFLPMSSAPAGIRGVVEMVVTPMVYGAAGASASAPAQAHDAYLERHPVLLVLPQMVASGEE